MVSRRQALRYFGAGAAGLASQVIFPKFHFSSAHAQAQSPGHVLLVMFMNGGWDGCHILQPASGPSYDACLSARPTLTKPPSGLRLVTNELGLHPQLEFVQRAYLANEAVLFPTAGISQQASGSHEEATMHVVRGLLNGGRAVRQNGFVADMLDKKYQGRAVGEFVAFDMTSGESVLNDAALVRPIKASSLQGLGFSDWVRGDREFTQDTIYLVNRDWQGTGAENIVGRTVRSLEDTNVRIRQATANTNLNPTFPNSGVGSALQQAFIAVSSFRNEGLEAITLNVGGFDTHNNQDPTGQTPMGISSTLANINAAYNAFEANLRRAGLYQHVTTLVVSEFGRTARENGSRGTDHGRGSTYFLLGGSVNGGQVVGTPIQPADFARGDNSFPVSVPIPAIVSQIAEKMGVARNLMYSDEVLSALPALPALFRV